MYWKEIRSRLKVAPLVGAWIEILFENCVKPICIVAPLVGAWIEMILQTIVLSDTLVAPLVGAWIEIMYSQHLLPCETGRSPCGSVD